MENLKWWLRDSLEGDVFWELAMHCWWFCDKTLNAIDFCVCSNLVRGELWRGETNVNLMLSRGKE